MTKRIILDSDLFSLLQLFKRITGVNARDCIMNRKVVFLTDTGDAGKAIGKGGANIKKLMQSLRKDVHILEYSSDITQMAKNFTYPATPAIKIENNVMSINFSKPHERKLLLGREQENLKLLKELVRRYSKEVERVIVPMVK